MACFGVGFESDLKSYALHRELIKMVILGNWVDRWVDKVGGQK